MLPFTYTIKEGVRLTDSVLYKIVEGNRRFKIKLYPKELKQKAMACDIWKCEPLSNEIYTYHNTSNDSIHFSFPMRKKNEKTLHWDVEGAHFARFYINHRTLKLYTCCTRNVGQAKFIPYQNDEFHIVLEPYERCWNAPCVGFGVNKNPFFRRSYSAEEFAKLLKATDDDLLRRKRQNQRKRSRTPPAKVSKKMRSSILAKTPEQKAWSTAKLKYPNKIVFIYRNGKYFTFDMDAKRIATYTDLSVSNGHVEIAEKDVDYYKACCYQKKIDFKLL